MNTSNNEIEFVNIDSHYIQSCFRDTLSQFPELVGHRVTLRRTRRAKTTMRAQPIINGNFFRRSRRDYRVDISSRVHIEENIPFDELPRPVLMGWMAHELGHIVDYLHRSAGGMLVFVVGYLFNASYRAAAERRADIIAVEHGFAEEILATKRYILAHTGLPASYLSRIKKYYMSPEEIASLLNPAEEAEVMQVDDLI